MKPWIRLLLVAVLIAGGVVAFRALGLSEMVSLDAVQVLAERVRSLGWVGPVAYVLLWVAACLFFIPGLPITLLGAAVFGAWWGLLWVTIGANLGAIAAFLVARYAARSLVESWADRNPLVGRIDRGAAHHGWRMVMVTRLVPVFPFNVQNYAYGVSRIRFSTYVLVTFLCMLPASVAFCLAGGSLVSGKGHLGKTFGYLAAAAVLFAIASLIPAWVKRRYTSMTSE